MNKRNTEGFWSRLFGPKGDYKKNSDVSNLYKRSRIIETQKPIIRNKPNFDIDYDITIDEIPSIDDIITPSTKDIEIDTSILDIESPKDLELKNTSRTKQPKIDIDLSESNDWESFKNTVLNQDNLEDQLEDIEEEDEQEDLEEDEGWKEEIKEPYKAPWEDIKPVDDIFGRKNKDKDEAIGIIGIIGVVLASAFFGIFGAILSFVALYIIEGKKKAQGSIAIAIAVVIIRTIIKTIIKDS